MPRFAQLSIITSICFLYDELAFGSKKACFLSKYRLKSAHFPGVLQAIPRSGASAKEYTMNRTALKVVALLCAVLAVASLLPANGQELSKRKLMNQDILDMASHGLGDDVILEKIRSAPETDFATDLESLKALKAAHVSDPVIRAMINPKAAAAPAAPSAAAQLLVNPDLPDDVGVYIK